MVSFPRTQQTSSLLDYLPHGSFPEKHQLDTTARLWLRCGPGIRHLVLDVECVAWQNALLHSRLLKKSFIVARGCGTG